MLVSFGFAWLIYNALHDSLIEFLDVENITSTLGRNGQYIRDYLSGANDLPYHFKSIATGFNTIFNSVHPLFVHFIIVSLVLTIVFMIVRIFFDIL